MKLIVATAQTQGHRASDFHRCTEGEPVRFPMICDRDIENLDGGYGCGRAFIGLNSHSTTTTAMVAELPITRNEYGRLMRDALEATGIWPAEELTEVVEEDIAEMLQLAEEFPVGTVIEKRGYEIRKRPCRCASHDPGEQQAAVTSQDQ